MAETWTALIGGFVSSFDALYLYNSTTYREKPYWSASREELDATEFDDDPRDLAYLRRLLKNTRVARDWLGQGFRPVIYRVRVSYDDRRVNKKQFLGRERVWPLSPLEQLAGCAE